MSTTIVVVLASFVLAQGLLAELLALRPAPPSEPQGRPPSGAPS